MEEPINILEHNRVIPHKHKISVLEIYHDGQDNTALLERLRENIQSVEMNRSDAIEIYGKTEIDGSIYISGYFHGTSSECDSMNVTFEYSKELKTWYAPMWNDDKLTILDFSDYFPEKKKERKLLKIDERERY